MAAAPRRGAARRPAGLRAAVVLCAGGWAALSASGAAWVGCGGARAEAVRGAIAARRAAEVYMSDVSPKGKAVMAAYQELCSVGSDDTRKVEEIMQQLDGEQKLMLKALLEAKNGGERPIETADPEVGDTVDRLYAKYKTIEQDDEAVVEWRSKMEMTLLKDVQYLIERDQMKSADEEAAKDLADAPGAEQAWKLFKTKYEIAAENGEYMSTPTRKEDIMYRFRRLKDSLGINSEQALQILEQDATPMVIDPLFIRRTYKAMVKCVGEKEALEDIVMKHPGALVVQAANVGDKIQQIKMGSAVIGAFAEVGKMFR